MVVQSEHTPKRKESIEYRVFPRKLELSGATCGFVVNYFCGTLT